MHLETISGYVDNYTIGVLVVSANIEKTNLWLVIPSGDRRQYLKEIINNSGVPKNKIVIVDTILKEPHIYKWWNYGINVARHNGATHVAILNDDLILKDNPLQKILDVMVQEDATIGYPLPASSDPCGYCFILNLEHGIFPDEKYKWWYGDNDLYERAKKVVGVRASVTHVEPNRLTSESPELMALVRQDKETYNNK